MVEEAGLSIPQGYGTNSVAQDVHAEAGTPGVLEAGVLYWAEDLQWKSQQAVLWSRDLQTLGRPLLSFGFLHKLGTRLSLHPIGI